MGEYFRDFVRRVEADGEFSLRENQRRGTRRVQSNGVECRIAADLLGGVQRGCGVANGAVRGLKRAMAFSVAKFATRDCGDRVDVSGHEYFLEVRAGAALFAISVAMDVHCCGMRHDIYWCQRAWMVTVGMAGDRNGSNFGMRALCREALLVGFGRHAEPASGDKRWQRV